MLRRHFPQFFPDRGTCHTTAPHDHTTPPSGPGPGARHSASLTGGVSPWGKCSVRRSHPDTKGSHCDTTSPGANTASPGNMVRSAPQRQLRAPARGRDATWPLNGIALRHQKLSGKYSIAGKVSFQVSFQV
eukprot:gene10979-biopygen10874